MEILTIKPPKGVSLSDVKVAPERLNFEIIDDQEYTISDAYRKELHNRLREWKLSPEAGISLEDARKLTWSCRKQIQNLKSI